MKKTFLKLFVAFSCILVILFSCRNEIPLSEAEHGHHHLTENQKVKITHLYGKDASKITDRLVSKMNSSKEYKILSREVNQIEIEQGEIDYSDVLQVIDLETGIENYTFRIYNHRDDDYDTFHNLVYTYDGDTEFINIFKYNLSETFAEVYNTTRSARNFSGSLSLQPISNDLCPELISEPENPGNPTYPGNPSYPFPGGGSGGGSGPGTGPGPGTGGGGGGTGGGGDGCTRIEITFTCTNCWSSYGDWGSYSSSVCGNGSYGLEITVSFISSAICKTRSCNPPGQIGVILPLTRNQLKIDRSLDNTNVKCILQKMSGDTNISDNRITLPTNTANDNLFQKMLRRFNGIDAPNITFKKDDAKCGLAEATTRSEDNGASFIIYTSSSLENLTNLQKEAILSHELVHALMLNDLVTTQLVIWQFDGTYSIANNAQDICDGNYFSSSNPREHFASVICRHLDTFLVNGVSNPQWMHELFNMTYFDLNTYKDALKNYLVSNHDWANDSQEWKNRMQSEFGFNWKNEVSEYVVMEGLQETSDFKNFWLSNKGLVNPVVSIDPNNPATLIHNNFPHKMIKIQYGKYYDETNLNVSNPNINCQ